MQRDISKNCQKSVKPVRLDKVWVDKAQPLGLKSSSSSELETQGSEKAQAWKI